MVTRFVYRLIMSFSIKPITLFLMILLQVLLPVITSGQDEKCNIINRASAPGESLSYIVSYNVFIFWTDVGVVNFTVSEAEKDKHKRLYLHATGLSFPTSNWFFKVKDSYPGPILLPLNHMNLKEMYMKEVMR